MGLRVEFGNFLGAKTHWFQFIINVRMGEVVWALVFAMSWMKYLKLENIIFKLDSKVVDDNMLSRCEDITEFGAIICDCKKSLLFCWQNSHVEFTRRQINMVAHSL